jgi:hypothetical protein
MEHPDFALAGNWLGGKAAGSLSLRMLGVGPETPVSAPGPLPSPLFSVPASLTTEPSEDRRARFGRMSLISSI